MKRIATAAGCFFVTACAAGHQASAPTASPGPTTGNPATVASAPTVYIVQHSSGPADTVIIPPAPFIDTRINAEISEELKVASDSAADAEMLERLDAARPAVRDEASDAGKVIASAVTWDIDVASFNSHDRVQYYLDLFQGQARERMGIWLNRMPRYEPMIRQRLQAQGLPGDLVYLALIESGFSNVATSSARAVGMWQFMRATGRGYGLRVDGWVDERRDPFKATIAATHFLHDLRERFGSPYLAAAAYNAGAGKVGRGLTRMGDDEEDDEAGYSDSTFFRLYDTDFIRRETKDYVPKLIAAALIAKEPERYGFHITDTASIDVDSVVVPDLTGLDVIARLADTTVAAIAELNPQYLRLATPPHTVSVVRLPAGRGAATRAAYAALPAANRVSFREHVAVRGQTSAAIAARYGISVSALTEANPALRSRAPRAGQRLIVPLGGAMSVVVARRIAAPERSERSSQFHKVRRGETLRRVAARFDVSERQLRAWNHIRIGARLRAGQRLRVAEPAAARAKKAAAAPRARVARRVAPAAAPAAHRMRRVQSGDTLTSLARHYRVSVQALSKANGLGTRSRLRSGTVLRIPG